MLVNTGGPAFPMPGMTGLPNGEFLYGDHGMTLRDYFAAKVMPQMTSAVLISSETADRYAKSAYRLADAMLRARENDY